MIRELLSQLCSVFVFVFFFLPPATSFSGTQELVSGGGVVVVVVVRWGLTSQRFTSRLTHNMCSERDERDKTVNRQRVTLTPNM